MDLSHSFWRGERTVLRAIEPEDWEVYFAWNQDDEQARALDSVPFPQSREAVKRWAAEESLRQPENDQFRFVIATFDGAAIGNIRTHHCDRARGTFSYGINILREHRGQGYASDAIRTVLRYYFRELRYQKVTIGAFDFNHASIALHERLGFQREGLVRRMHYSDGRFSDMVILGLLAEEFVEP